MIAVMSLKTELCIFHGANEWPMYTVVVEALLNNHWSNNLKSVTGELCNIN